MRYPPRTVTVSQCHINPNQHSLRSKQGEKKRVRFGLGVKLSISLEKRVMSVKASGMRDPPRPIVTSRYAAKHVH
ncbi:hypothetical protein BaRGS_00030397, partial [Batillaria attramentaria]